MDGLLNDQDLDMRMDEDYEERDGLLDQENVAIIDKPTGPENFETKEKEVIIKADNYEAMAKKILPTLEDLEIVAEDHFTWEIKDWKNQPKRSTSEPFEVGGSPWKILFFPHGNNADFTSLYLEHGFDPKPEDEWYSCVQFALVLWNPKDPTIQSVHHAQHRFNVEEGDWGFTRFYELRKLFIADEKDRHPMVENDEANITAYVRVVKDPTGVLWHNFNNYDSKKQTGYVGLKNQGATCYLNSLIQSLYFTKCFRKAVYQIPTENEKTDNSALTLQRLFYQLQTSQDAVGTSELTKSFGWETKHIFEQQDVQELNRILMERLEVKMKGTDAENALTKMFVGRMKTYISCVDVDFESSRTEDFWDVQLNVRGFGNLDASFQDYVAVETLDGENKYQAEGHGLQVAKKGVIFESFPPVFHMQLKRFEYDMHKDAMMKVNDHWEFPEVFDATPYLSDAADKSEPYIYHLHGVLVHSGDLNAGHYYAFLKPEQDGKWFKFDDDRVTPATTKEVLNENYGGDLPPGVSPFSIQRNPYTRALSMKRSMSAYMLVYLRKSRLDELIPMADFPPPDHLQRRLEDEKERQAANKKEKAEQHLYLTARVVGNTQFRNHQGCDLASWDGRDAEAAPEALPKMYRILKAMTIKEFVIQVAEDLEEPPEQVRLWVMVNRQNKTIRPDNPLCDMEMTVESAAAKYGVKGQDFRLWAEVASGPDAAKTNWLETYAPPSQNADKIVIFLKYFDAEAQSLSGVQHLYISRTAKGADLQPIICVIMAWPNSQKLDLFEEIKPQMIEPIKPKQTFQAAEIQDGDIVCFQKSFTDAQIKDFVKAGKITDAKEFYEHLLNKIIIKFVPKPNGEEKGEFELVLSKKYHYDDIATKVAEHLGILPTHLRFTQVGQPQPHPRQVLKRNNQSTLQQMLVSTYIHQVRNDQIYYEILELSLQELETKKVMKITWLGEDLTKEEPVELLVPKNGKIQDVIEGLQQKFSLSSEDAERVKMWEVHGAKIYKDFSPEAGVTGVGEYSNLYAEKLSDDDIPSGEDERYIKCYHYQKEPNKPHGVPFRFVVKGGELFKDTKVRLQKRTGLKGKNFEKIQFSVVQRGPYSLKPIPLTDDSILADLAKDDDSQLGLDHADRGRNGIYARTEQALFVR